MDESAAACLGGGGGAGGSLSVLSSAVEGPFYALPGNTWDTRKGETPPRGRAGTANKDPNYNPCGPEWQRAMAAKMEEACSEMAEAMATPCDDDQCQFGKCECCEDGEDGEGAENAEPQRLVTSATPYQPSLDAAMKHLGEEVEDAGEGGGAGAGGGMDGGSESEYDSNL